MFSIILSNIIIMDSQLLTLISNLIYLICGIILLIHNKIIVGIGLIIMWYISHTYHKDRCNKYWSDMDMIFASLGFIYIMIKHFNQIICINKIIFLLIVISSYVISRIWDNLNHRNMYNICHSIWHIVSAIFITQILLEK